MAALARARSQTLVPPRADEFEHVEGSFIVNSKYKFVELEVLAARVAKQQPALPRLAPGAGWMARQAKRTGRQVKVCRAARRDNKVPRGKTEGKP